MKTYFKTLLRTFKQNLSRFFAVTFIILLGISFVSGLGTLSSIIKGSLSDHLINSDIPDIIIKSTSSTGFDDAELQAIASTNGVAQMQPFTVMDLMLSEANSRVYVIPIGNMSTGGVTLLSGRLPESGNEILAERSSGVMLDIKEGDVIKFFGNEMTVVGIVSNPLIFSKDGEPALEDQSTLELIAYIDSALLDLSGLGITLPVTDVYVNSEDAEGLDIFSEEYMSAVSSAIDELTSVLGNEHFAYLTLKENKSWVLADSYTEKVDDITSIFPAFFIAVAALVVLTTMTRMIEEERSVIGCYKTLGYSNGKIAFKYIGFSFACCILGSSLGIASGIIVLPAVIYPAFNTIFYMPEMSGSVNILPGVLSSVSMLAAVAGVTAYSVLRELGTAPAYLLKPKSPKAGGKIFLERIPFLWNPLKFKYKSAFRNIFRYVNHLIMTVVAVAGSTALVLAGLGLRNIALSPATGELPAGMSDSLSMIAGVVILFAAFLCILVIYNLTNMNISERKREIATLKVLGYHGSEVSGYIYREIFIMSIMGVAVGLPSGYFLLRFVLMYLDFGSVASVKWYSYLLTAGVVMLFVGTVSVMLNRVITNTDMNASLKTIE